MRVLGVGIGERLARNCRGGVDDLIKAHALFPGSLEQLLTTPIRGLERHDEMICALTEDADAIKVYVEMIGSS